LTVDVSSQDSTFIPAMMMATGVVSNGKIALSFSNTMSIVCMKNPTMQASKGTAVTQIYLNAANVYTVANFSVDGSGNLIMTPSTLGTITKACNFTPNSTDGTTTDTYISFAVFPNTLPADLNFSTDSGNSITVPNKSLDTGKYYYFTPNFPIKSKSIILQGNQLDFSIESNGSYSVGGVTITAMNGSNYSSKSFTGKNGNASFTFSLTDTTLSISKIEIFCSTFENTSNNNGWTDNITDEIEAGVKLLKWPADSSTTAKTSVTYAKSISDVSKIIITYN